MSALHPRSLKSRGEIAKIVVLTLLGVLTFIPFISTIIISFKSVPQFNHQPFLPTFPLHFRNYVVAYQATYLYILNSVYVSAVAVVLTLVVACASAYAFARFDFPLKQPLYMTFIGLLMIPPLLSLVTRFIMVRNLGLINTHWSLIAPFISGGQVFMIFVAKTFFESLPEDLFESARLDGAREMRILWSIALPMSRPIIWTLAVLNIQGNWNNILWPLITLSDRTKFPVSVGLLYFQGQYVADRGPMMAGYIIASVPMIILFTFASRQFVEGMSSGALKL
jgi:ABC-type glycerol-3-phosphate transport system permease component